MIATSARCSSPRPGGCCSCCCCRSGGCSRGARTPAAIVFSRVAVLARGPRAGAGWRASLALLRNLALASGIVALARPRAGAHAEDVDARRHQHRHRVRHLELDARAGLPAAESARGRARPDQAVRRSARSSDRIGVVAFSGEALTQVPLTTDYPGRAGGARQSAAGQLEDGTAIGTAIATAANRLRDAPGRSRVMILLTDGVNNRGSIDPRTAAKAAAAVRHQDLHDRRRHRRHGARAGGPRPVRAALRECRRCEIDDAAAHRRREGDGRPLFPRARRRRRCSASPSRSTRSSASRCARARTCATRSCFAGRSARDADRLACELLLVAWKGPLP